MYDTDDEVSFWMDEAQILRSTYMNLLSNVHGIAIVTTESGKKFIACPICENPMCEEYHHVDKNKGFTCAIASCARCSADLDDHPGKAKYLEWLKGPGKAGEEKKSSTHRSWLSFFLGKTPKDTAVAIHKIAKCFEEEVVKKEAPKKRKLSESNVMDVIDELRVITSSLVDFLEERTFKKPKLVEEEEESPPLSQPLE